MKQKQRLLTILMTLLLSVTGAWALNGSGTSGDPYQLGSVLVNDKTYIFPRFPCNFEK